MTDLSTDPPSDAGPDAEAGPEERVARALAAGGPRAAEELLPLVYDELRDLARRRLAELGPGRTLQATALVHEAWLRVAGERDPGWDCRAHFYGAAARAMRLILVDDARRRARLRHGGAHRRVGAVGPGLEPEAPASGAAPEDLLALDEALGRLEALDPVKAEVVALRYFAGLTVPDVARVTGLAQRRVEREWRFARAWLQSAVEGRR